MRILRFGISILALLPGTRFTSAQDDVDSTGEALEEESGASTTVEAEDPFAVVQVPPEAIPVTTETDEDPPTPWFEDPNAAVVPTNSTSPVDGGNETETIPSVAWFDDPDAVLTAPNDPNAVAVDVEPPVQDEPDAWFEDAEHGIERDPNKPPTVPDLPEDDAATAAPPVDGEVTTELLDPPTEDLANSEEVVQQQQAPAETEPASDEVKAEDNEKSQTAARRCSLLGKLRGGCAN
jgi:hypothetical protein